MRDFLISVANDVRRAFTRKLSEDITQGIFDIGTSLLAGEVFQSGGGRGGLPVISEKPVGINNWIKIEGASAEKILAVVREDQDMNGILASGDT